MGEDLKDAGDQFGVVGQAVTQRKRKRQDPLTDWHVGKDAVHQMGRGIGHPAAATGGAERAPLREAKTIK